MIREDNIHPKPLLVCSGGTSSGCAGNGQWTFDLRKNYQKIEVDSNKNIVEVEGGINMGHLTNKLESYNLSFPIGLSSETGLGYILTGGVSPLTRSFGLAIEQVLEMKGIWGSGEPFNLSKPTRNSTSDHQLKWRALCTASPFLSVITALKLKTIELEPLIIWQAIINQKELADLIKYHEQSSKLMSFQWIWGDYISGYGVIRNRNNEGFLLLEEVKNLLKSTITINVHEVTGIHNIPRLNMPLSQHDPYFYSEVISLIGSIWSDSTKRIIKDLSELVSVRPDKRSFIASQQIGYLNDEDNLPNFSFMLHKVMWKPWINASWPGNNKLLKKKSLKWAEYVWDALNPLCPGVHMAQINPRMTWHNKATKAAFREFLPELKQLKLKYDPKGILPSF